MSPVELDCQVADESRRGPAHRWWSGAVARQNTAFALLDQAMVSGTSFLVTLLVGRICGSQALGLYSLGFSLVVLALGVQTALVSTPFTVYRVRYGSGSAAAAHGGSSLVASGLVIAFVTSVFVAATGLLMWTARFDDFVPTAWAICIALPWLMSREFARRFDLARLKMGYACLLDAGVMLLTVAGLQLAIQAKFLSPVTTFVIMAIAAAATSLAWLGVRFRRSELRIVPATILPELQRDLQFGRWVVADQMLAVAHLYILHWLLAWVVSTSATGILAACFSIAALASPFLQGMGNFLSPQFVESVTNRGRAATYHLLWKAIAGMVLVMTVYAVAVSLAGNWLLGVLYADASYVGYGHVVGLLAFRGVITAANIGAHHAVVALESPRSSALASLIGVCVTSVTALLLMGRYGLAGAAAGALLGAVAETAVVLTALMALIRQRHWPEEAEA